jgi:hypothetical protein
MATKLKLFDVCVTHTVYCNYSVMAKDVDGAYMKIAKHQLERFPIEELHQASMLKSSADYIRFGDVQFYVEQAK